MSVLFTEGLYMPVTIVKDYIGNLHLFEGAHNPTNRHCPTVNGDEAKVFFQFEQDIETAYSYLTAEERDSLENGWTIVTQNFPTDYFYQS